VLAWPTLVLLKFKDDEYEPVTVSCGPNFVMVVGNQISKSGGNKIPPSEPDGEADNFKSISRKLRQILEKKGSLVDFFRPEIKS